MPRFPSWLISGFLHLAVIFSVGVFFLSFMGTERTPLRIHFHLNSGTASASAVSPKEPLANLQVPGSQPPASQTPRPLADPGQAWQPLTGSPGSTSSPGKPAEPVWTSEDLLVPTDQTPSPRPSQAEKNHSPMVWEVSSSDQNPPTVPPLPPAELVPLGGAEWDLRLTIPGAGGFPLKVEGAAGGRPELDQWLTAVLKDRTFPPSLSGEPYQLRWKLVLKVGRPE